MKYSVIVSEDDIGNSTMLSITRNGITVSGTYDYACNTPTITMSWEKLEEIRKGIS